MPTPYYGGFDQDLFIENEIIRFPVHLSSEVSILLIVKCTALWLNKKWFIED